MSHSNYMNTKYRNIIEQCADGRDCFYLYDENTITESLRVLKENFPDVEFLYSIKCNPNSHVMDCVFAQGLGADAASLGEVRLASAAGLAKGQIYYSAPGKTARDIEEALDRSILIADSLGEVERIRRIAAARGETIDIGLRINPDFAFDSGVPAYDSSPATRILTPSKFGIDEDQALQFLRDHDSNNDSIRIKGIHVHLRSQVLSVEAMAAYYAKVLDLAERVCELTGELDFVNMGSGIGVPYAAGDQPLDLPALGSALAELLSPFRSVHPGTRILIEVGRYAVCKSGLYVTRVLDRKVSRGVTYIILKNTLNGFIRPSLAMLAGTKPTPAEPLYTGPDSFQFIPLKGDKQEETVTLVGNLCTATDVMAEDIRMPHLEPGDLIAVTNAGSYAAVLSPMQFSSQEPPAELFLTRSGQVIE